MAEFIAPTVPRPANASNTHEVYTRLREMVLNGEVSPGTVISQVKLARELGVSTTPLREAMRLLQAEGLLIAEHNQRSRVAPIDTKEVDAVYASRVLMEALAVRLTVPEMTEQDYAALRLDLATMAQAARSARVDEWEPAHRVFHRRLINRCDVQLIRLIEPLVDRSERYRRFSMFGLPARTWEIGNKEHEAIVEACSAGEAEQASVLLARHYTRSALTMLAKFAPEESPNAVRAALHLVQRSVG